MVCRHALQLSSHACQFPPRTHLRVAQPNRLNRPVAQLDVPVVLLDREPCGFTRILVLVKNVGHHFRGDEHLAAPIHPPIPITYNPTHPSHRSPHTVVQVSFLNFFPPISPFSF